ncbi:MAG: BBP7 family outer membrane beta-barrel protein [Planctomycetes bacterium]|nr:BBP7 family outer membrane beta-barrel protein [Planctomycetota bacterium]
MARWWKRWEMIAAGLLGMWSWPAEVKAQSAFTPPPPTSAPTFAADPKAPQGPDFPNVGPSFGPNFPNPGQGDPNSPFSRGGDSGLWEDDGSRATEPYWFILRGEYLNWRMSNAKLATPLITTSLAPNLTNNFGALNQTATQIVLDSGNFNIGEVLGGRVTMGVALGYLPAIEGTGFWLNRNQRLFSANSDGGMVLARPLFLSNFDDPTFGNPPLPSAYIISFPGSVNGGIQVQSNLNLWGFEVNGVANLGKSDVASLDFLLGYRYVELREGVSINDLVAPQGTNFLFFGAKQTLPGEFVTTIDNFGTRNQFNGGQVGFRGSLSYWRFNVMVDTKIALGMMREELNINGSSTLYHTTLSTRPPETLPGGVLAVASNSGLTVKNEFAIVPELGVQLGFQITRNWRAFVGGNLFYISSVARAGDSISNNLDSRLGPTLSRPDLGQPFDPTLRTGPPNAQVRSTDFWGYGFSLGLEFAF